MQALFFELKIQKKATAFVRTAKEAAACRSSKQQQQALFS